MIVITAATVAWFVGVFLVACSALFGAILLDERALRREDREDAEPPSRLDRMDHADDWGGWRP